MSEVRVLAGELFQNAEFPPTNQLTPDAESENSRRFVFSAVLARLCDDLSACESSLFVARERRQVRFVAKSAPKLSRSRFNRGLWVSNLVGFGVAKQTGFGRPDAGSSWRRFPIPAGSHCAINRATPMLVATAAVDQTACNCAERQSAAGCPPSAD